MESLPEHLRTLDVNSKIFEKPFKLKLGVLHDTIDNQNF